jgi:flagellar protein FlaG
MSISPIVAPSVQANPTVQQNPTPVGAQATPETDPTVSSGSAPATATPTVLDNSAVSGSGTTVSSSHAAKIANALQNSAAFSASGLSFSTDKESGRTVITVTDPTTDQVIRQIPTQEALEMTHTIDNELRGKLINQKA